jgi:hypothetical protein
VCTFAALKASNAALSVEVSVAETMLAALRRMKAAVMVKVFIIIIIIDCVTVSLHCENEI